MNIVIIILLYDSIQIATAVFNKTVRPIKQVTVANIIYIIIYIIINNECVTTIIVTTI